MLKIQAFQRYGIKTAECVNTFEFCCWEKLREWLDGFAGLNRCPNCNNRIQEHQDIRNAKHKLNEEAIK